MNLPENFGCEFCAYVVKEFDIWYPYGCLTINNVLVGYHIRLPNGWVASVQFGPGTYSDNHDVIMLFNPPRDWDYTKTKTAEIAFFHNNDSVLRSFEDGDAVKGYQTVQEVLKFIENLVNMPHPNDLERTLDDDFIYEFNVPFGGG